MVEKHDFDGFGPPFLDKKMSFEFFKFKKSVFLRKSFSRTIFTFFNVVFRIPRIFLRMSMYFSWPEKKIFLINFSYKGTFWDDKSYKYIKVVFIVEEVAKFCWKREIEGWEYQKRVASKKEGYQKNFLFDTFV